MSGDRFAQIGLDRLVRLDWLEKTSSLVLTGNEARDIKKILQNDLQASFRSSRTDVRGSLDKTITILMKVWLTVPVELEPFRVDGIELLKHIPRREPLAIHWGMLMAVYPFWSGVATQTGRLLRLQDSAAAAHVQRRVREQYGERETVSRAVRRVLRSYLDWGVLQEAGAKGIYSAGATLAIDDSRLIAWLAEASLHARATGSAPLKDLIDSPSFFPFRIKPVHAENLVAASSRLDLLRLGLDDNLIMLRKQTTKTKEDER
ncbi:MAG TPA: hypothetical protein VLH56_09815 [Dissulfurispiraceae bacterium]|nr:hypothetical protein [Dissulfurispiraceae bacterium]